MLIHICLNAAGTYAYIKNEHWGYNNYGEYSEMEYLATIRKVQGKKKEWEFVDGEEKLRESLYEECSDRAGLNPKEEKIYLTPQELIEYNKGKDDAVSLLKKLIFEMANRKHWESDRVFGFNLYMDRRTIRRYNEYRWFWNQIPEHSIFVGIILPRTGTSFWNYRSRCIDSFIIFTFRNSGTYHCYPEQHPRPKNKG